MDLNLFDESCGGRKKEVIEKKLFQFESFASAESADTSMLGSFRDNIRFFLHNFSEHQDYTVNEMPVWRTFLVTENDGVFPLYTVEETVSNSLAPYCDHCRLSGWGHHFVCKRRYYLIIPAHEDWDRPLYLNPSEVQSHNLCGLIHCNGYGHLVRVNGIKDNTSYFTVSKVMEFWDRLCTFLKARMISVHDVSRKGSVELRLVHSAAYGHSWYQDWGYKYSDVSCVITEQEYSSAIMLLSSLNLERIISDFRKKRNGKKIKELVDKYRELSDKTLVTISDLLQCMLSFKSRFVVPNSHEFDSKYDSKDATTLKSFVHSMVKGDCRWSARRLEGVLIVIVNLLKQHKENSVDGSYGMSRHELREEARNSIGDTGLIDFVLKCIRCFEVDKKVVRRVINPYDRLVEFTINDVVKDAEPMKLPVSIMEADCRWSKDKLEHAVNSIVNILKENEASKAMPLKEVRDRVRYHICDPGLTDFVLKSLDGSTVGNQVVHSSKNPKTKSKQFALTSVSENLEMSANLEGCFGLNLSEDVLFVYNTVLLGYSELNRVGSAARLVLECNQFVKEFPIEKVAVNHKMTLSCKVLPSFDELNTKFTRRLTPGETVLVRPSITIGELKAVAQCALRDTYCVMDRFEVNQIGGLKGMDDELVVSCVVDPGSEVWVRGSGLDLVTGLRYEDGSDTRPTINANHSPECGLMADFRRSTREKGIEEFS